MTLQQKYIRKYIDAIIERNLLDVGSFYEDENLMVNLSRISYGEYIALDIDDDFVKGVVVLDSFRDTATISSNSIIISYEQLEKYFHEQQQL